MKRIKSEVLGSDEQPKVRSSNRTQHSEVMITIAAERFLRDRHFEKPEEREAVLEEAKRQASEVGYSIVTKGDIQRVLRSKA